jgi:F-type H+-transporting ATPase subunit b
MAGGLDATMVAAAGFAVFVGGMLYLKVPAMAAKALDAQSDKIAKDLAEAKRLREEAQAMLQSYEDQRLKTEAEAEGIIAKAREDAARLKQEAEAQLTASIATRARQAEERIKRAEETAIADVRAAAASAAIATAEHLLVTSARGKAGEKLVAHGIEALAGKFSA